MTFNYQTTSRTVSILSFGAQNSGVEFAPYHCNDGLMTEDETGIDCGGNCNACDHPNEANLAMAIKTYYDIEGEWAGIYLIHSIPILVWEQGRVSALYAYASVSNPDQILGYDSRVFVPQ